MSAPGGNIKVVVRVRPFNNRELDRKAKCIVSMDGGQTTISPPPSEYKPKNNKASLEQPKSFAYDRSYWSFERKDKHFAGQENVFEDLGKPLLDNAFQGYNNCIFAYGQTGSGKSYSMMGYGAESGVIPRICREMFNRIDGLQKDKNTTCTVEVSYLEIYNEKVRDLLNPANKGNLKVREHPSTGPYVEDLAKLVVRSNDEIENLMDEGNKARTVAATNMNETSSRSHAVFTLTLTQKKHDEDTKMDAERVAKISLVDLAGSERATSTGATGARLKEGAEINRSLSTLGRVIAALADVSAGKKKNASMIPYRDSVLTWLLKDSLGGNSLTAMIAAISPADINFEETLSTLRYADSAKRIKQHAVVNEDANARMIRELKEELAQLRAKLGGGAVGGTLQANGQVSASGAASEPQYDPDTPLDKQMVTITNADGTSKQVSKADIAEQLSQSEKLYTDLNQTWEQKLQKTEEIHKERESALEDLGISIEKGFVGVSTPKKMPHLVNLSDDPLLAECLIYNLKPGRTTVGNDELSNTAEIRLKGSKIMQEHCFFENNEGVVSVIPTEDAAVMVNGLRIDKPKRLHSGFRIILGDFHIFRFNHPQEAAKERAEEGSRLKQSMTVDELDPPSTTPRHERSRSRASAIGSDDGGARTPGSSPYIPNEGDYDWSFARREAAGAILGGDQNIANLTDEQLDVLFDDLQRVRATRRLPAEARLRDGDDDQDSVSSFPSRDKHMSAATSTLENFSLDTSITTPSTPPQPSEDTDRIKIPKGELQQQLEKQRDEYQNTLKSIEESNAQVEEMRQDKVMMEQNMQALRDEMKRQKEEYEKKLVSHQPKKSRRKASLDLDYRSRNLAQQAMQKWRQRRYVRMAAQMLHHASKLKEAQILSQQMGKQFAFQFAIVDAGQALGSSYDMVLNGISAEDDDDDLVSSPKPCVGVRVTDFKGCVIYTWSMKKFEQRVQTMRQMQQYQGRPEYVRHFKLDDPFSEATTPQYTRVGEAQTSLSAVFESRVQDFTVDVISPYTFSVIGILKLSLEPSLAEAPAGTIQFNVVLHEMMGFPEMEGTDIHAQLFLSRAAEESGMTTTQHIQNFNDGPVKFDSCHVMTLPVSSSRQSALRISVFARVSQMHLDKLLSWDEMQDTMQRAPQEVNGSRVHEDEFRTEEKHDILARVQILELAETGEYSPVDVLQHNTFDPGAYQLHQGLQRRVVLSMSHNCAETLPFEAVTDLRAGQVQLLDSSGQVPSHTGSQQEVPLKILSKPYIVNNADGTSNIKLLAQWDSSAHASLLLDRPTTSDKFRVQITLQWSVHSPRLRDPLLFSHKVALQIRTRTFIRAPPLLSQLWNGPSQRSAQSTAAIFVATVKPSPIESARDLWRLDTQYEYVKGEETLTGWSPRGVSLIREYIQHRRRQLHAQDVETTKSIFSPDELEVDPTEFEPDEDDPDAPTNHGSITSHQRDLLLRFLEAWRIDSSDPGTAILSTSAYRRNSTSKANGSTNEKPKQHPVSASLSQHTKNPHLVKSGHLLMPDSASQTRWVRRYLELRRPYIHVYSVPEGEELSAINLSSARVDHQPQIAKLLQRGMGGAGREGGLNVFAIYAAEKAWVFATRSEREKVEWVLGIDEGFLRVPEG